MVIGEKIYIFGGIIMENVNKIKFKRIAFSVIGLLVLIGLIMFSVPYLRFKPVIHETFTDIVNAQTLSNSINFKTNFGGIYNINTSIAEISRTVITSVKIENKDGEIIWDCGSGAHFYSEKSMYLKAGEYNITFAYDTQSADDVPVNIQFKIR